MGSSIEIAARRSYVDCAGQFANVIEQRCHTAGKDAPTLAEVLVAMDQDRPLLGERRADAVCSFTGLGKIRSRVDVQVAEHSFMVAAGQTAHEHRSICVSEVDAIAGVAQDARKALQLGHGSPDQLFDRLREAPNF